MRYSSFVDRIGGEGAEAWLLHNEAIKRRKQGADVIVLSIGDPNFDTPAAITEAAISALRSGDSHYTDVLGYPELRQAIAAQYVARAGLPWNGDNVAVMVGTQGGLFAAALCLLDKGDEAIALEPTYVTYEATIQASGARLVRVPQRAENGFKPDLADIARAVTPRTRAIFFATPNNPTGVVLDRNVLEGIADIARKHDLWVVADEVYADLIFGAEHVSIASLPGMAERTVTVNSLSKSHAMTGWRIGWLAGPSALIAHIGKLNLAMTYGIPAFIQRAAIYALTHDIPEVATMRAAYRKRRDIVAQRLAQVPGLRCHLPEAGMFMMLDIRETGLSARDYAWGLFEKTGVSTLDATAFGKSAAGHLRLSFATDEESLGKACSRIAAYTMTLPAVAQKHDGR